MNVATPLNRVPPPITVVPSLKVTLPVGVPPIPVMVAVKVIVCPNAAGFGLTVKTVVVGVKTYSNAPMSQ